jgi:predicted Ser/Thr protein kinase
MTRGCLSDDELLELGADARSLADVDAHLDACETCRTLVAESIGDPTRARTPARVGRYLITGELGCGGMGIVYRARDPKLDRDIAIKVLARAADGSQLHEARALARIAHPSVVAIHDVGEIDGAPFIAMELVDGSSLDRWLASTQRTVASVLDVIRRAGAGLAAAHAAGVVHGDVKPSNILVARDGRVVVIDFGLALVPRGTAIGGTRGYMAPEQADGRPIDARADQYALCVVLREALSHARGRVPRRVSIAISRGRQHDPDDRFGAIDTLLAELAPRRQRSLAIGAGVLVAIAAAAWPAVHDGAATPAVPRPAPRLFETGAWLLVGGLAAPAPSADAAARQVAAYVRARMGPCASTEVSGARVTYALHGCALPSGIWIDGALHVTYTRRGDVLVADISEPAVALQGGTASVVEHATWQSADDGSARIAIDATTTGVGARGIAYTAHWTADATELLAGCELVDGSWSLVAAGTTQHARVEHLETCPGRCPHARAAEMSFGGVPTRIAYDGTRRAAWRSANGEAGVFDLTCDDSR